MAYENFATIAAGTTQTIVFNFNSYRYIVTNNNDGSLRIYVNNSSDYFFIEGKIGVYLRGQSDTTNIIEGVNSLRVELNALTIQRELINTAPTQPGAFTQPTGELEIGDTRAISWGTSTDAETNFRHYVLEASVNNGAWQSYSPGSQPNFTYAVSTAGTLKFRVKAVDTEGLESPYRESPIYTVTKPKYYWSKYNVSTGTRGSLIQTGIIAVEDAYPVDGIHTDGFWYVRGSRVNNSIPPTGAFTAPSPTAVLKPGQGVAVTFAASTAPNISLYEMDYRYNTGLWTTLGTNNTALTRSFTPTIDKTLTNVQFRVRAKNTSNIYSDYVYSETFNIEHNAKPTLTLTTANNLVLAETNTIVVAGQALDTDTGNVVNVYYQINTGNNVAIATGISNGTAPLPFSKTLTFKEGKLLDGTTVIASNLVETQTYSLKVWSEDNQGGKSDVQTRSFKVIPNRAPLLTVAAITQKTGLINNDTIAITGTVTDPENQTVKVKYKINGGELIQGYSGAGGNFSFNIKAGDLLTDNTIEIQASDTYDLITTKKYKFTKVKNAEKILKSVVRYKVTVPVVGTTGIVTWIERENGDLTVAPDLSMRMTGETEVYTAMEKQVTAPVNDTVTEDQYRLTPASAKTDVTLKLTLTKTAVASDKGVKKITGALQ